MKLREEVAAAIDNTPHGDWNPEQYAGAAIAIVLERAAKVAEQYCDKWSTAGGFEGHTAAARIISRAIRSLGQGQ